MTTLDLKQLAQKYQGFNLSTRTDSFARGLIEAICEHGVGHPIPESIGERQATTHQSGWAVHGCDGCCRKFPGKEDE